jgi:hypothetical protein
MVRKRFAQIIPQIPAHAQPIRHLTQEQAFGADVFEKHHQLEFEEHHRINGGTPSSCIGVLHKLAHKREIKCALQVTIEMILWY